MNQAFLTYLLFIMEQILNINDHPYWVEHPEKKASLEAKINETLAAGTIFQDGEVLEYIIEDGARLQLLLHVQTAESRVSGDTYNMLDIELLEP